MNTDDISKLIEFADRLVDEKTGQHLETIQKDILRQTLTGKKLSAIHFPGYENSYVQRFCAPRLWERLSVVTGEKVRKKTVLEVLTRLQSQQERSRTELQNQLGNNVKNELNGHATFNSSVRWVSYCNNPNCSNSQNPHHLNFCQECNTLLLTEHLESKKVEDTSSESNSVEFQSSYQTSDSENPDQTKSSTYSLLTFMNFIQSGMPLLLSVGVIGCLFTFSWLANWYGVKNHLAGKLPNAQLGYFVALKLNPSSAAAHYNQGAAYEDQQNYKDAHSEYQLAIEGGVIEAYNNQARLYILQRNYDGAVSLLRIGLPLAKNERVRADMYKNRGSARLMQGRLTEAKLDLIEAIKLKSDRAPAYCLLAQVVEREGNKKGALVEWENCLGFAYSSNTIEEDKWINLARQRLEAEVVHR
ncbi:tetratricopeptide repeat protein [Nostoc commune]|uniref:tetratricopeptide repeat protein n=1 Tax=Nostoc commune TaxID=1178 RepID=UPI0018C4AA30|nr:tetratricopeptide repeat protein [Nostoc commune]MBG1263714.1 tetratricopeptide repeat protein [Nostoc commune BAE]